MKNPTSSWNRHPEPTQPLLLLHFSLNKKREGKFCVCCCFYLRLLSTKAAATAITMMTATPIAMYVAVGAALVGGITTGLGVGATVVEGVTVGAGVFVSCGVGGAGVLTTFVTAGFGEDSTANAVFADEP